jgi:ATP-dependent DNA helicase RecG
MIEAWGRGTIKIVDECKKAGLPEPEFREEFGGAVR